MAASTLTAVTRDGVRLAVSVAGDGEPVLLIPGLGAARTVFDPIAPQLARRHRVITFDPRGIGASGTGSARLTLAILAADAAAVLDALTVQAADVFGASMGGLIAQHLALDHPARVRHLVLAATGPGGDAAVPADPRARAALLGRGTRTPADAYRLACTVLYSPQFQRAHPEFIEAQVRWRSSHPVRARVFSEQLAAMRAPDDSYARLAGLTVPSLVLHGTEDAVTPFENARLLAQRMPHARTRWFESCGHLFFHERADESARVIDEFMRDQASGGSAASSR